MLEFGAAKVLSAQNRLAGHSTGLETLWVDEVPLGLKVAEAESFAVAVGSHQSLEAVAWHSAVGNLLECILGHRQVRKEMELVPARLGRAEYMQTVMPMVVAAFAWLE